MTLCPICNKTADSSGKYCQRCLKRSREYNKKYRAKRKAEGNPLKTYDPLWHKNYREATKLETLAAYGGAKCKCCGESTLQFLTLDHVNNDGNQHRKTNGRLYASYLNLKAVGFPNEPPLQVLCYNCNNGKRINNGICPHKQTI